MSQIVNVGKNIKDLLFDNWDFTDELDRKKIIWSGNAIPPKLRAKDNMIIEVSMTDGVGNPQSLFHTQLLDLYGIHYWKKLTDPQSLEQLEKENTNRALVINQIMKLIHDNQTAITGIKIGTFARSRTADEFDSAPFWLHTVIFVRAELYHTKTP